MEKEILKLLKANKDIYLSGAKISIQLNVSRTAVWKVIKKLREKGYNIESVSSKGYRLVENEHRINDSELALIIEKYDFIDKSFYYDEIDSTNDILKRESNNYSFKNLLAVSSKQTKGKGRLGRVWESNDGLYMSYLLRPDISPIDAPLFTQIGAAAIIETFNEISDIDVKIKWPNDIVINGKKICGILTELNAELSKINYLVLGIGVNLNQIGFNDELSSIATSYKIETGKDLNLRDFLEVFLKKFDILLKEFINEKNIEKTLNICRKKSIIIGKEVNIINANNIRKVEVIDINEKGQLLVLNEKGEEEAIFYGEVSIRGIDKLYI
ncbi:biotin--[acetyl-CoA-carboxylase] ligase [Clostridiaceae bacterium HSG29]|nr:biotin--[acetyl-CoA-carboxylase] ligase [Clostridiaceae bacterium HSG29]